MTAYDMRISAWRSYVCSADLEGCMAAGVDRVHAHRARAGRSDLPFTIGALSGPMYVGEPAWDAPRCVRGAPEKLAGYLRTYREMGVDQVQVSFVRRSADALCDQISAFAAHVAPPVNDLPTTRRTTGRRSEESRG